MRLARLDEARRAHLALVERADTLGPGGFFALRKRLASLSEEYQVKVPGQERQAGQACERKARERQLRTYLARYRVDDAKAAGWDPPGRPLWRPTVFAPPPTFVAAQSRIYQGSVHPYVALCSIGGKRVPRVSNLTQRT